MLPMFVGGCLYGDVADVVFHVKRILGVGVMSGVKTYLYWHLMRFFGSPRSTLVEEFGLTLIRR